MTLVYLHVHAKSPNHACTAATNRKCAAETTFTGEEKKMFRQEDSELLP